MAKYFQDFVGLNTFVYEVAGSRLHTITDIELITDIPSETRKAVALAQNQIGSTSYTHGGTHLGIRLIKNNLFSHQNTGSGDAHHTASLFNSMLIKRNGPYGYPMWQQLRVSQNPVTRGQKKQAIFTFVTQPGPVVDISTKKQAGQTQLITSKYSSIKVFQEPVVTQKFFPLVWNAGRHFDTGAGSQLNRFSIISSYGNNLVLSANDEIDKLLKIKVDDEIEYETIKQFYLNGGLEKPDSPLTHWEFLKYQETIFPRPERMFTAENRSRTTFESFYFDNRERRVTQEENKFVFGNSGTPPDDTSPVGDASDKEVRRSIWPLDAHINFMNPNRTGSVYIENHNDFFHDRLSGNDKGFLESDPGAHGILWNPHVQFMNNATSRKPAFSSTDGAIKIGGLDIDNVNIAMSPGPLYARRHSQMTTSSVSNPSGMDIPETGSATHITDIFAGDAKWEAGLQAAKNPFYDSYADYNHDFRVKYKNFTMVPEFRVSSHVADILQSGSSFLAQDIFEMTGGAPVTRNMAHVKSDSLEDSSQSGFYKTYSTTDFLRHFELFDDDHEDFTNSQVISLKCKAVKKFLPYEGFYPCQRTVTLAEQFFDSYGKNIKGNTVNTSDNRETVQLDKQAILTPLFAPGVLFNTIKSGVAVDYPICTGSLGTDQIDHNAQNLAFGILGSSFAGLDVGPPEISDKATLHAKFGDDSGNYAITTEEFNKRIPFEALVAPEEFLAGYDIANMEPHASGNMSGSAIWNGEGDQVYKLMAHNFLAETTEFFMKNQNMTTIVSRKQGDPNFGQVIKDKVYAMRIRMYRTMDKPRNSVFRDAYKLSFNGTPGSYLPPQDIVGNPSNPVGTGSVESRETFTMYSRPSAFGPPSWGTVQITNQAANSLVKGRINQFDSIKREEIVNAGSSLGILIRKDSAFGYNFPFTPPYYHGEGWLDIVYTATATGKVTVDEIINNATVTQTRFDFDHYFAIDADGAISKVNANSDACIGPQSFERDLINVNAVQITSSINAFGRGALKSIDVLTDDTNQEVNVAVTTDNANETRWVIQPKFETPMLNFNHIKASNGNLSLPVYGSESVPRGMWHQLGKIPQPDEGVYLRVGPIDEAWQEFRLNRTTLYEDLSEVCGFSTEPVKLGKIAEAKTVHEAVVAVPFIEKNNRKNFFLLDEEPVRRFIDGAGGSGDAIGLSIKQQITKMKKYIFPPSFDFINNETVDPIAMYIFEFKHTFDQEDLAHMWQNLPPKIGRTFEEAQAKITHPLLKKELLGGGVPGDNKTHRLPDELKWMVFKVKQRAANNYFKKVVANNSEAIRGTVSDPRRTTAEVDEFGLTTKTQFNWPYDFFSLVEMVKIDAEVEFNNIDYSNFQETMPSITTIKASEPAIVRGNEPYVPDSSGPILVGGPEGQQLRSSRQPGLESIRANDSAIGAANQTAESFLGSQSLENAKDYVSHTEPRTERPDADKPPPGVDPRDPGTSQSTPEFINPLDPKNTLGGNFTGASVGGPNVNNPNNAGSNVTPGEKPAADSQETLEQSTTGMGNVQKQD